MSNDTRPHISMTGAGLQRDPGGDWSVQEDAVHHIVGQAAGSVGSADYSAAGVYDSGFTYDTDGEVLATNGVRNPSPQVNATGFTTQGTGVTGARVALAGVDPTQYGYVATFGSNSTDTTAGPVFGASGSDYVTVVAGETVYPSTYVASNASHNVGLRYGFFTSGGVQVGSWTNTAVLAALVANAAKVRIVAPSVVVPGTATRMVVIAVNPSAASDTWVGQRTNLAIYTGAENNSTVGYTATINAAVTTPTTNPRTGTRSYQVVTNGVAVNEGLVQGLTAMVSDGIAGVGFVSFWLSAPVGSTFTTTMSEYTTGGAFVANRASVPVVGTGTWQRVTATGTKATAANVLKWQITTSATPQARTFYVDDVAHGTGSTVWDFFDGSTVETGRTIAWTGAANASTSTRSGDTLTIDLASTAPGDYFDGATASTTAGIDYQWTGTAYNSISETVALYIISSSAHSLSKYLVNNANVFSHQENDGTLDYGKIAGRINSASPSGASVSISQSTYLQRFVAERDIPAVSSGTAIGALDLASQLVSPTWGCTLPFEGTFWSLNGHDAGFGPGNVQVRPEDLGIPVAINDTISLLNYVEYWPKIVDNANVQTWADPLGEGRADATALVASSPYPVVGEAHLAMWVADIGTTGTTGGFITAGPENLGTGTGMSAAFAVNGTSDTISIDGTYNPGGVPTPFSVSASIAALDTSLPLQVAVAYGWTDNTHWRIRAWVVNGDGLTTSGTPVVITTGSMASNLDKYADPIEFSGTGSMRYLYQERLSSAILTDTTVSSSYLVPYIDVDVPFSYEYHGAGDYDSGYEPIAGFEGNVWDYLSAVLSVFGRTLRVDYTDGIGVICDLNHTSDEDIEFDNADQQPSLVVSTEGVGQNIDYILYSTENVVDDIIYDAFETGEVWSVNAGETRDIRIETGNTVTMARNPRGAYSNADYELFSGVYGSYIVSGADNLPIQDYQWTQYGGQVLVTETGVGYINLRLVAPPGGIPGVDGPYVLGISDGSTTYPRLTLIGSGVKTSSQTIRRGTGADPEYTSIELATTINNPAITSYARLYTSHFWASKVAAGPKILLTATLPRSQWEDPKFGLFQGSTFVYEDVRWRVISGTVTELGYQFTAMNFTTNADFEARWPTETMDDFDAYWADWQMKDFHIAPLR